MLLVLITVLKVLARAIRKEKEIKTSKSEQVELSLFAGDMTLYIEDPKDFSQILLGLINTFNKGAGYKINIQKLVVVLCTSNSPIYNCFNCGNCRNSIVGISSTN